MTTKRNQNLWRLCLTSAVATVGIWVNLNNYVLAESAGKSIISLQRDLKILDKARDTDDISLVAANLLINNNGRNNTFFTPDNFLTISNRENLVINAENTNLVSFGNGGFISIDNFNVLLNNNGGNIIPSTSNPEINGGGGNIVITTGNIILTTVPESSTTLGILVTTLLSSAILIKRKPQKNSIRF